MDEGLLNIISAGCGQLIKMLIMREPHILKLAGKMTKKRKQNIKKKILVPPGLNHVELQENLLDHSATT